MRRYILVLCLSLYCVPGLRAQEAKKLDGIWELTVSPKKADSSISVKNKPLIIGQNGDKLTILDFHAIDRPTQGSLKDNTAEVPLHLSAKSDGKEERVTFTGSLQNGDLIGSAVINNETVDWKATRLASVWVCSHTNPVHATQSVEGIRELTQLHGCKGWHKLKSSNAQETIMAFTADKDKNMSPTKSD
jgi:hypothetical protein